jgi:L-iditol 2-dehydrogenase
MVGKLSHEGARDDAYKEFEVQDMPEPAPGPRDVIVRVKACGICGSDVHGMDGSTGRRRPPIVMGHEAAGVVEQVGAEVQGYKVGDRVTFDSTIYNPRASSRSGLINLCDDRRVLGVSCEDYRQHGAFAELVSVPHHILYALPPGMTYEQAALVEPVSIAVHARNLTRWIRATPPCVTAAGLIGDDMCRCAMHTACKQIIAV